MSTKPRPTPEQLAGEKYARVVRSTALQLDINNASVCLNILRYLLENPDMVVTVRDFVTEGSHAQKSLKIGYQAAGIQQGFATLQQKLQNPKCTYELPFIITFHSADVFSLHLLKDLDTWEPTNDQQCADARRKRYHDHVTKTGMGVTQPFRRRIEDLLGEHKMP